MSVADPAFKQAGRSAASTAVDLPAPSGGREEVLRSGPPGMMPGEPRWAMDGPWRRTHGAKPARGNLSAAKAGRQGQAFLVGLSRDNGRQEAGYRVFCLKLFAYSFGERYPRAECSRLLL